MVSRMKRINYNHHMFKRNIHAITPSHPRLKANNETQPNIGKKIMWMLVVFVFLAAAVYQCVECFRRYSADPSDVTTYYIYNKTITFPAATICPFNAISPTPSINPFLMFDTLTRKGYRFNSIENLIDYLGLFGYWDISAFHVNTMNHLLEGMMESETMLDFNAEKIIPTYAMHGRCLTVREGSYQLMGLRAFSGVAINGSNSGLTGYLVYIHLEEDLEIAKYMYYNNAFLFSMANNWQFYLRVSQVIYRNTRNKPCQANATKVVMCLLDCIEKRIYSNLEKPCRLPYSSKEESVPLCSTWNDTNKVINATLAVIKKYRAEDCNCLKKCRQTVYNLEFMSSQVPKSKDLTHFSMFYEDSRITVTEEVLSYDFVALCVDLGGAVGLFLGIGFLQIYELIVDAVTKARQNAAK